MFTLHRIALPSINAAFITLGLLYAMFLLVDINEPELVLRPPPVNMEWTQIRDDTPPVTNIVKPTKLDEPEIAPEVIIDNPVIIDPYDKGATQWVDYDGTREVGVFSRIDNSQLILAIGYPPTYPASAIQRGIEGYAVVGFSVDSSGAVFDAFIIESEPNKTFDKSALKAIKKFKYKARMVDGKPVSTDGQRYMFTYKIDS